MLNIERTAQRLTDTLFRNQNMSQVEKAKLEYGLSIVLGITIELALTLLVSAIFGTAIYTAMIMLSALFLRFFTGGAHCSTFNRCLLFTILLFVPASLLVRFLSYKLAPGIASWAAKSGSAFCLPLDLEYPYKALCSLTPERS
ncbi:MAG: accessory gene regulator B family protein [Dethiobacteria bacterium]